MATGDGLDCSSGFIGYHESVSLPDIGQVLVGGDRSLDARRLTRAHFFLSRERMSISPDRESQSEHVRDHEDHGQCHEKMLLRHHGFIL